jgi:hypothetical protein
MSHISNHLEAVEKELALGHGEEPERLLTELINQLGPIEFNEWKIDLLRVADRFQSKRRKRLRSSIEGQWRRRKEPEVSSADAQGSGVLEFLETQFRADLRNLTERYIFQWATMYREVLSGYFREYLTLVKDGVEGAESSLGRLIAEHSHEIFNKGYIHGASSVGPAAAEAKQLGGVNRFLEIPLEFYTDGVSRSSDQRSARALRSVVSATMAGVLEGFAAVSFGGEFGSNVLLRATRSWAHYVGFLRGDALLDLLDRLGPDQLTGGIKHSVLPVVQALDKLCAGQSGDYFPLPVLGQFSPSYQRVEIAVRPPPDSKDQRLVEVHCYLDEALATQQALEESSRRSTVLICAPIRADLRSYVDASELLAGITVDAEPDTAEISRQCFEILDEAFYRLRSQRTALQPLTYNPAREFPLRNRGKARFFHVSRTSVRDLLRTFERMNGVRLWCSVRRSGKTTACFDLGQATGNATVVGQTCDSTMKEDNANLFYDLVLAAIEAGSQLDPSFVEDGVRASAPLGSDLETRSVLILDEYETLFNRLRSALNRDPDLRYTVVQPLLNQLLAFTTDNLLVFLGQQPDAHYLMMDQNQLSAYVEQDSFPLFQHYGGTATGEFSELVRKILTDRIEFDWEFADALHVETSGHPYLTVNVLVELVEWLIEEGRPARGLRINKDDLAAFSTKCLVARRLTVADDYQFFRQAASEAMSDNARVSTPWLHAIYKVLHEIGRESPDSFSVSIDQFEELCNRILGDHQLLPGDILRSGVRANFLSHEDDIVRARIPLLARIAACSRPALYA